MLIFKRHFLSFFICQFFGALNDNLFRLALIAMLSFGIFQSDHSGSLIQLAAAIFMLPFFLFSAVAGEITDASRKRYMLIGTKTAELFIMSIAAVALYFQSLPLVMLCLFLTGAQSAFFGPIKYSLLPLLVQRGELLNANAWFRVSTFAAILIGTLLGSISGKSAEYIPWLGGGIVLLSLFGLIAATQVSVNEEKSEQPIAFSFRRSFGAVSTAARADRYVLYCIFAGSWFWLVAALLLNELAQMPYALYISLLGAVLGGVVIGAFLCRILLRGKISNQYAPLTLLIGAGTLFYISRTIGDIGGEGSALFLQSAVVLFAAVMTLYVVPLGATIQARSPDTIRAKVIAAYNIVNALFIVGATVAASGIHALIDNAPETILFITALLSLTGAVLAWAIVPVETIRRVLHFILSRLFRVRVEGAEHLNEFSTLVCNHQSYLDGLLLAVFLQTEKRQLGFPIETGHANRFFVRQSLKLVHHYPLNPLDPHAVRNLIRDIQKKQQAFMPLIFPEGRLTTSGGLMKTYPGAAIIAQKVSGGKITPVIIDGSQYATVSNLHGKYPLQWLPQITLRVFPPHQLNTPAGLHGKPLRQQLAQQMSYLMEEKLFATRHTTVTNLTRNFAAAVRRNGGGAPLFCGLPEQKLTFRKTYISALAIGELLRLQHDSGKRIGLMLPSSVGAAVMFYAAVFQRLTPVMLNPSVGSSQAISCCQTATVDTVYTARQLVERVPAVADITAAMEKNGIRVVYLEDMRPQLTARIKLKAAMRGLFLQRSVQQLRGYHTEVDEHAAVLFTSGSEGMPKGVALSHKNLVTNCQQVLSRIDIAPYQDVMLNALPVFHVFGLLAGMVLPVMSGVPTWQYPSPLHYKIVPEVLYNCNITIFFSANTFLYNYGKAAHPYDMHKLRLVFAGAEKLRDETRQLWADKFGVRVLEGYGVTETSPALAVNTPLHNLTHSVGRLLPGIETRLLPVEGVDAGGRLQVRGDNIMAGYFIATAPGELIPPADGWHDTGDIVDINSEGYLTIVGRAKRFIKIAGEMVPLDRVEECLHNEWADGVFAAVGIADTKRGESLALATTLSLSREDIAAVLKKDGLPELWQPRQILLVKEMPLLSTGKINYPAVTALFTE